MEKTSRLMRVEVCQAAGKIALLQREVNTHSTKATEGMRQKSNSARGSRGPQIDQKERRIHIRGQQTRCEI